MMHSIKLKKGALRGTFFLSFYREIEISIGVGFVLEREMPPLAVDTFEPVSHHRIMQDLAVLALPVQGAAVIGMALDTEPVEGRPHLQLFARGGLY